jgi:hypothetical protein
MMKFQSTHIFIEPAGLTAAALVCNRLSLVSSLPFDNLTCHALLAPRASLSGASFVELTQGLGGVTTRTPFQIS